MIISIVVACRNEAKAIRSFIESVLTQDFQDECEIVVADGLSDDGTRAFLNEYANTCPRLKVINNDGLFVAAGLNAAIRASRGDVIVRMDAHTEYAPDYVRRCWEVLRDTGAQNVGGPARTKATGWVDRAIAAAYHSPFSCGGARFHDDSYEGPVDTVTYGCWRRETLESLGLFDEEFIRNQDDELNLRLVRAGGLIWQSPRIVSWYHPRPSLIPLFRQYFQYGFWKVLVIRKHRLPARWQHLVPGAFVISHAALCISVIVLLALEQGHLAAVAAFVWAVMTGCYAVAVFAASCLSAWRRGWDLLPLLPVVFAVYHIAYGAGFLRGMVSLRISPQAAHSVGAFASRITR